MLLNYLLPLAVDEILSLYCQSPPAVISEVPLSYWSSIAIRSERSLLRLAAAVLSGVRVYSVCSGGRQG